MKVKNQYLKILEYLHLSFNKWPSLQYKFRVSLVLWNHNNGEDCWLGNDPEDEHWHSSKRVSHRRSLLKGVAVYRVLYQSILNAKLTGRKNLGRKRCTSNRDDCKLENTVKQSRFKHLGELHKEWTEAGVSASRVTTLRRLQEKGYQATSETETTLLEVQCEVSTVSDDLGCHVICWCWSTVFYEVHSQRSHLPGILEHFMLPSADKLYGDADFIFQQDLAPAHTAKGTKSWFNDHGVTVLNWPANSPDLNPIENLWGIVKRKMRDTRPNNADELKATVKETWASIPPQQCHKLITSMPRRIEAVIKAKGAPTKYWVHIQ